MEYILRKGGWVRAHGFFLITFLKKGNSLVQRKENFRWNHITCLFNWLRLRNYIHRENVDTHIHSVHLTYKLSFNIQSSNIYLIHYQRLPGKIHQQHQNWNFKAFETLGNSKAQPFFVLSLSVKQLLWQDHRELTRAQEKRTVVLKSVTFVKG